jgi:hypothetical protein
MILTFTSTHTGTPFNSKEEAFTDMSAARSSIMSPAAKNLAQQVRDSGTTITPINYANNNLTIEVNVVNEQLVSQFREEMITSDFSKIKWSSFF